MLFCTPSLQFTDTCHMINGKGFQERVMPTIRIPGPGDQSIMLSFAQIPAEAKTMFRRGFSVLARWTKDKQALHAAVGAVMLLASAIGIQSAGKGVEDAPSDLAQAELLESIALPKLQATTASTQNSAIDN